jgi:hypothetical protein
MGALGRLLRVAVETSFSNILSVSERSNLGSAQNELVLVLSFTDKADRLIPDTPTLRLDAAFFTMLAGCVRETPSAGRWFGVLSVRRKGRSGERKSGSLLRDVTGDRIGLSERSWFRTRRS